MKALPKEIYVTRHKENNGEEWLNVNEDVLHAIEDDGPTTIGVYQFVRTIKRKKVIAEA